MKERTANFLCWLGTAVVAVGLVCLLALPALARWKAEYVNNPPEVTAWFQQQKLTPSSKAMWGFDSCCSHADVCQDCVVHKVSNKPPWKDGYIYKTPDGEWKEIPAHIIEYVTWTPTGKPVLFLFPYDSRTELPRGSPVCLKVPGGAS